MNKLTEGLRPLLGEHTETLDYAWLTGDSQERHELEVVAELMRRQAGRGVLLDPPSGDQASGPISLGRIRHGNRVLGGYGLTHSSLMRHTGVFGSSGSGKSNLVLHVLVQLIEQRIPWVLFDYKRSARSLVSRSLPTPVRVLTTARGLASSLRFNILSPPPGVLTEDHDRQLAELISQSFTGGDATVSALVSAIERTRKRLPPLTPTLRDVRDDCRKETGTGRAKAWKQTLMRILDALVEGPLGRVIASRRQSEHLDLLLHHHTVIELDGLSSSDGAFLASVVVRHLVQTMMHTHSREKLRLVCVIEEAHRLLSQSGRESVLEQSLREARELGLGLIVVDQTPSHMSHTALANLHTFVAMRLGQQADVQTAARSLLLREDQRSILHALGVGQAVVRSGHWPSAVQIDVPKVQIQKGSVSDRDLEALHLTGPYARGNAGSTDPACKAAAHPLEEPIPPIPRPESPHTETESLPGPVDRILSVHPDAGMLLRDVIAHPVDGVMTRYRRLGLSRRRGDGAKKTLLGSGLVTAVPLRTPEGSTTLLEPSARALEWASDRGVIRPPVNGSLIHEYWCDRIAKQLDSLGWNVQREVPIADGRLDVLATRESKSLAVEVETGKSNWAKNIERLAFHPSRHKFVLWLEQETIQRARTIAPASVSVGTPTQTLQRLESLRTQRIEE
ncbi:MAG: ATP-binding protein [Phycisphaerales bacterium]|nr:ATP-binding protein [Phycisphaerales bacterium]MCB9837088.1 ATP-binding protein [Phycisphaera sp.]